MSGTNTRETNISIKATDLSTAPIKQVVEAITGLIAKQKELNQDSRTGNATLAELTTNVKALEAASGQLLKQKAALAAFDEKEAQLQERSNAAQAARVKRDQFEASLPNDELFAARTKGQIAELNRLEKQLAAADKSAERAGETFIAASNRLERMGVAVLDVGSASRLLSENLLAITNAIASASTAQGEFGANSARAKEYIEALTAALKGQEVELKRVTDAEKAAAQAAIQQQREGAEQAAQVERTVAEQTKKSLASLTEQRRRAAIEWEAQVKAGEEQALQIVKANAEKMLKEYEKLAAERKRLEREMAEQIESGTLQAQGIDKGFSAKAVAANAALDAQKAAALAAVTKAQNDEDEAFRLSNRAAKAEEKARLAEVDEAIRASYAYRHNVREFDLQQFHHSLADAAAGEKAQLKLEEEGLNQRLKLQKDYDAQVIEGDERVLLIQKAIAAQAQAAAEARNEAAATETRVRSGPAPTANLGASAGVNSKLAALPEQFGSKEITDVTSALDKLEGQLKRGEVTAQTFQKQMEAIAAVQKKIATDATLIDQLHAQRVAVEGLDAAFIKAGDDLLKVTRAEASGGGDIAAIKAATAEYNRIGAALERQVALERQLDAALKQRGVDTVNLIEATSKVTAQADRLVNLQQGAAAKTSGTIFGLSPYNFRNLEYQINDVVTQLSLGQGLLRTFESQAGQIFQIFEFTVSQMRKIALYGLPLAAGVIVFAEALLRLKDTADSLRNFNARLTATGEVGLYTSKQLTDAQRAVERFGVSFSEAGKAIEIFQHAGIAPDRLVEFGKAAQNLVDIYGVKLPEAAKEIATAFTGGIGAIEKLNEQYHFLTGATYEEIRALIESGHAEEARTRAFNLFKAAQQDGASLSRSTWQVEIRNLTNAWHDFLDVIGNTKTLAFLIEQLKQILQLTTLIIKLSSGEISILNFTRAVGAIASGEALPNKEKNDLADKRDERAQIQRQLDVAENNNKGPGAKFDTSGLKQKLEALDAEIKVLEGKVGIAGIREELARLDQRQAQLSANGSNFATGAQPSNSGVPASFGAMRDAEARRLGVDPDAVARLQRSEGVYQKDGTWQTSTAGAVGSFQVKPDTFNELKSRYSDIVGDITSDAANITAGIHYFKEALVKSGGDFKKAVELYHDGLAHVGEGSKDAREQSAKAGLGYTGNPLGNETLAAIEKRRAELNGQLPATGPGSPAALATSVTAATNQVEVSSKKFADELNRKTAELDNTNLRGTERVNRDIEKVNQKERDLRREAAERGATGPEVEAAIQTSLFEQRKALTTARDKEEEADRNREKNAEQALADAVMAIRAKVLSADKTNLKARLDAIDVEYAKIQGTIDKVRQASRAANPEGIDLTALTNQIEVAKNELKAQATVETSEAIIDKILAERKAVYEAISLDLQRGIITIAQSFERMNAATAGFAPRIRKAVTDANEAIGKLPQTPATVAALAKNNAADADGTKANLDQVKKGFVDLELLQKTRSETTRTQTELEKEGLTTREGKEAAIKQAFDATKEASDGLILSLRQQLDLLLATKGIAPEVYTEYMARLTMLGAQSQYVSQFQRDLIKTFDASFVSHGSQAIEGILQAVANLATGTGKLKDVFSAVGIGFANMAAGILKDIGMMILKMQLLAVAQEVMQAFGVSPERAAMLTGGGRSGGAGVGGIGGGGSSGGGGGGSSSIGGIAQSLIGAGIKQWGGQIGSAAGGLYGGVSSVGSTAGQTVSLAAADDVATAAAGSSSGGFWSWISSLFATAAVHGGQLIGAGPLNMSKSNIDPSVFRDAVRYHMGGMVGLASDEVPAILQRGEEVVSKAGVRAKMGNSDVTSKQPASIRQVLVFDKSQISEALAGSHGEQVVMTHIKNNSGAVKTLLR